MSGKRIGKKCGGRHYDLFSHLRNCDSDVATHCPACRCWYCPKCFTLREDLGRTDPPEGKPPRG